MAEVVKVTSKGQITLPVSIRKSIDLKRDSYLIVEQIGDYVVMRKAETRMDEITELFEDEAKRKGITKEKLLETLKKVRREMWAE